MMKTALHRGQGVAKDMSQQNVQLMIRKDSYLKVKDIESVPPFASNNELAKNVNSCQNGTCKKATIGRLNVHFPCFKITDPEANNELAADKEKHLAAIIATYRESLEESKLSLGYPANFDFEFGALDGLQNFVINNVGDPFIESYYTGHSRQFEVGVLDWFAQLWEIKMEEYWGYVTNGGTEGNLHGILVGRELFPNGIFYTSKDSHYSVFKAAHMYRMDCMKIETLSSGEMDCAHFKAKLLQNKDRPAIINLNLGTTMKGAIDDVDMVIQTLEECGFPRDRFYIHCDGSMYGLMLPLLKSKLAPQITFKKPIGSISVCGHKFIGTPMPCGITMTRPEHINVLSKDVEYMGSRDATITGSRSGQSPIFLWYSLNKRGFSGLMRNFKRCLQYACLLKDRLKEAGVSVMLNKVSSTVVFERPKEDEFIRRWQLACEGNIAHVVVMPSDTIEKLDTFYLEFVQRHAIWSKNGVSCVAQEIGEENCACSMHK